MAMKIDTGAQDALLDAVAAANRLWALPSEPADYGAASSSKLAEASMAGGDFAKDVGSPDGRKLTIAAKNGVAVTGTGTATHVALVDTTASRLLFVTTAGSEAVTNGGEIDVSSFSLTIGGAG